MYIDCMSTLAYSFVADSDKNIKKSDVFLIHSDMSCSTVFMSLVMRLLQDSVL